MINYKWSILEVFVNKEIITKVKFLLKANDGENIVETEGYHTFFTGTVYKTYAETKEEDLIRWLDKDTTQEDVNIIKLNLENQLKALKTTQKVEFPWEANTFTIG
jgi:hypothetical protein